MLGVLRLQLDLVDDQLVDLLHRRMQIVQAIAKQKKELNLPPLLPEQEAHRLARLALKAQQLTLDQDYVCDVYASIFEHSRTLQETLLQNK